MELDEVFHILGAYGRYQVLIFLAISWFDNLPSIWHMSVMAFIGYEPQHHCKVDNDVNISAALPGRWSDTGTWQVDKCRMYVYDNETRLNETTRCTHGWWYNKHPIKTSIVTDWDLVCDRNVLPETSQMVFNFGVMFGALVFGYLSDRFGRKKSFIIALLSQAVVGAIAAASPNFYVFAVLRFLIGAFEQGVNITGFVMATELFPPKQRTLFGVAHEYVWAIGGAILPGLAYFLREWRHLQLAVSLPSVLGVILIWTVPESVVWLQAKGRYKECEAILENAARWNNVTLPENCLSSQETTPMVANEKVAMETARHSQKNYTHLDLFRTPMLRKITICVSILWAVNTMVYYGLSYNTPNLYGNMYLNFFIGQLIEIPSVALTMILIYKVGRRWPLCLFHVFGGIVCIVSPFIPRETADGTDITWISVTLAMLGKFGINSSFTIIFIYGPEIYPTVIRNTGAAFGSMWGRIGGILYPFVNYLAKINIGTLGKQLPIIIFGVMSILGGLLALPLPETKQRPLPETIEDVENYEEFCKMHRHFYRHDNGVIDGGTIKNDNVKDTNV